MNRIYLIVKIVPLKKKQKPPKNPVTHDEMLLKEVS